MRNYPNHIITPYFGIEISRHCQARKNQDLDIATRSAVEFGSNSELLEALVVAHARDLWNLCISCVKSSVKTCWESSKSVEKWSFIGFRSATEKIKYVDMATRLWHRNILVLRIFMWILCEFSMNPMWNEASWNPKVLKNEHYDFLTSLNHYGCKFRSFWDDLDSVAFLCESSVNPMWILCEILVTLRVVPA